MKSFALSDDMSSTTQGTSCSPRPVIQPRTAIDLLSCERMKQENKGRPLKIA
jgi:hypothetical protein